jgi:thiol-disulfide isomerase/thioredoxin
MISQSFKIPFMVSNRNWLFLLLFIMIGKNSYSQQIRIIKYPELQQILDQTSDSILVVNFWATWCAPCVAEIPHFEKVSTKYSSKKVKVILVSLDAVTSLKKKVEPFVARKGIRAAQVLLLDETDYNAWIDKVAPEWSGALPFTLIVNMKSKMKKGFERPFTEAELVAELDPFIN